MKTISIDPSLTGTAVCIYNNNYKFYLFHTEKNNNEFQSIDYTLRLSSLIDKIKNSMDNEVKWGAVEGLSFGSIGRMAELGGLSYFIRKMFIDSNISFIIVPPTVLKKYWTGKGNASKIDMIAESMKKNIEIPFTKKYNKVELYDDNCVDALALSFFLKDYLSNKNSFIDKIEIYKS